MAIAHGRLQAVVAEQELQLMHRHTRFQLLRRIGMAQAVDAADLLDAGTALGGGEHPLRALDPERSGGSVSLDRKRGVAKC